MHTKAKRKIDLIAYSLLQSLAISSKWNRKCAWQEKRSALTELALSEIGKYKHISIDGHNRAPTIQKKTRKKRRYTQREE